MRRTLLIKSASGKCDMACRYCFYADEVESRSIKDHGMMDTATAHLLIDKALDGATSVAFGFQGGEPTLSGLPFFQDFTAYAKEKAAGRPVSFTIQTNGRHITQEWASFLHDEGFLVGLSLDGPKKTHDLYRHDKGGNGTFKDVFNTMRLLQKADVDHNILITVTEDTARHADEVYDFMKRNGEAHLQFIPCIDPMEGRGTRPWSLTAGSYGRFLIRLFKLYKRDWERGSYVSVRYFDNLVHLLLTGVAEECGMNGRCGDYFVVEADGTLYPCDFYVLDGYCLGDIHECTFDEADKRRHELGFVEASLKVEDECRTCQWYRLCRGGCRRDREDFQDGGLKKSCLCPAYKAFFSACANDIAAIAKAERDFRLSHGIH